MRRLAAILVLVLPATLLAPTPSADAAFDSWPSGFGDAYDLATDRVHDRIFVAGDAPEISVINRSTGARTRLETEERVSQLTMTSDGSTLLGSGQGSVVAVETATLVVTEHPLPDGMCAQNAAVAAAGYWWFIDTCRQTGLHAMDPATGEVTSVFPEIDGIMAASPVDDSALFVATWSAVKKLAVVGGETPSAEQVGRVTRYEETTDLDVAPDGRGVLAVSQSGPSRLYDTTTLAPIHDYADGNVAAYRADGMLAIGGSESVRIYRSGEHKPFRVYGDAEVRYISDVEFMGEYALFLERDRRTVVTQHLPRLKSHLAVQPERREFESGRVEVAVTLDASSTENRRVDFYYRHPTRDDNPPIFLSSAKIPVGGSTVRVPMEYTGYLEARYTGDDTADETTDLDFVAVRAVVRNRAIRYDRRDGSYHLVPVARRMWIAGRVLPDQPGECVRLQVRFRVDGRWRGNYDECFTLGRESRLQVGLKGGRDLIGVPIRMRFHYGTRKTQEHGGLGAGYGKWVYYRLTG